MSIVFKQGDKEIGAFWFPDRKKPSVGVCDGNQVTVCGSFHDDADATYFMNELGRMFGKKQQVKVKEWIPVNDGTPEDENAVLICTKSKNGVKNIDKGYFIPNENRWVHRGTAEVTHWMPLPDLPEAAE